MQKLVLTRAVNVKPKVKRFVEQAPGGRRPWDCIVYINDEDNVVTIGNAHTQNRFPINTFASGHILYLPNNEKAAKVYVHPYNVYILTTLGNVYVTGYNSVGQAAVGGTIADILVPTATKITNCRKVVTPLGHAGNPHSAMFILNDGTVYSAGANQYGQLGNGTTVNTGTGNPSLTLGPGNTFGNPTITVLDVVAAGSYNANYFEAYCALLSDNTVWCVGYGASGQMGNNTTTAVNSTWKQVLNNATGLALTNIASIYGAGYNGNISFYALSQTGVLYSWGYNAQGQLGINSTANATRATEVTAFGTGIVTEVYPFTSLAASVIVKKSDGNYYSCGNNTYGQLGLGDTANKTTFQLITSLQNKNIGNIYICGSDAPHVFAKEAGSNRIYSTGWNAEGQLGLYNTTTATSFTEVPFNITSPIINIMPVHSDSVGGYTLILTADGNTYFTGDNRFSYIGVPDREETIFRKNTKYIVGT